MKSRLVPRRSLGSRTTAATCNRPRRFAIQAIMNEMIVLVYYPEAGGRLRLRTELDWNLDVSPEKTDGATARFRIATDRRHLAFKPVLWNGSSTDWSRGENYLWLDHHRPLEVFPYFRADAHCSACQLRELSAGGGRKHRFRVFYPPGYHENTLERYPVVYLQDGQNCFFRTSLSEDSTGKLMRR